MARTDDLAENQLVERLAAIRTDLDSLRTTQKISGRSGVLGYGIDSGATWDATGTVNNTQRSFVVRFQDDGSQSVSMTNLSFRLFVFNTSTELTPFNPSVTVGGVTATLFYSGVTTNRNSVDFYFDLRTTGSCPFWAKAVGASSSRGTVSIT